MAKTDKEAADKAKYSETKGDIVRGELGAMLHTALRKHCDTDATSVAYNAIHLEAMNAAWRIFLDAFWKRLPDRGLEAADCVKHAMAAVDDIEWGASDRNLLRLVLARFTVKDWEGCTFCLWYRE